MKLQPVSILRWRDRPPGGASDEDRAGALARDALLPGVFTPELDDRQLARVEQTLKSGRRARPPLWLRPALVALLLTASVASVMGFQSGWFAPLRMRDRFRSIPKVTPQPVTHERRTHERRPAPAVVPGALPVALPAVVDDKSSVPETAPPLAVAPAKPRATATPGRKLAVADEARREPAGESPRPTEPPEEIRALERAMGLLRGKHDALAALAALDDYVARYPSGVLGREARVARVDALLMLKRSDEALLALEALPLDQHRRSTELQLIRGELRARTDCARAEADFTAVLARVRTATLEERALYGRASCRSRHGDVKGTAEDLRRYLARFPEAAHASWARRWLQSND